MPALLLALWAIGVLMIDLFFDREFKETIPWITLVGIVLSFVDLRIIGAEEDVVSYAFHNCLRFDRLTFLSQNVILGMAFFLVLVSARYLKDRAIPRGEYYALLLLATISMMMLAASNELLTLFLNIEVLSITLYILAGIERENLRTTEAAFKYFLMGSFAAAFLLFGLTMVYGAMGTTQFNEIHEVLSKNQPVPYKLFLVAGLSMMLVGFGFKLTLAPFHMYAPDLYAGAPTPVGGMIATGSKVAGLAAFFNFFRLFAEWNALPSGFYYGFCTLVVLSIIVGNVGALTQPNIKRLLAYSGVAHAGYALIPLIAVMHRVRVHGSGLMGSAESAVSYYLLAYSLMTALAFGVAATLGPQGESHIDRYSGLARRSPFLAAVLALSLISLAGIPFTVGFMGKVYLFAIAVNAGLYPLACFGVLASVASAYYYLRIIVKMYMEEPQGAKLEPTQLEGLNGAALIAGSVAVVVFAMFPIWFLLS